MARRSIVQNERLRPPRRAPGGIERGFLTERARAGLDGQFVLIEGPAGYGKTELLSGLFQTLLAQAEQVAWLSLAPEDAGEEAFTRGIAAAFGFADGIGGEEQGLPAMLDAIGAIPARRLILLLDDVDPTFAEPLGRLIANVPEKLRIAVATRGETGVALSRHRMRGLLTEIGPDNLSFSRAEMRRLLPNISAAELETLAEATGGWPAIVRLIAARLGRDPAPHERAALLSGHHRECRDFLRDEVLSGLPAPTRRMLAAAACLDEAPPVFVHQLAGLPQARADERFEALAPLAMPLPQRPGRFALHPMLKAVLEADMEPLEIRRHHSKAAAWFAAEGQIEKAVRHAAEAGDFGFAAETIKAAGGVDLFLRAGYTVLRRLVNGLPSEVVHASPGLRLCAALVLAKEGRILAAREALEELKSLAEEGGSAEVSPKVLVHIDSLFDVYEDTHFEDAQIEWLETQVRSYRVTDTWERGWLHNHLCIAYTRNGDLRLARLHALKALDCYREEGAAYAQAFMLIHLALVNLLGGRLSAAATFGRQAEDLIQRTQWSDDNLLAIARIPMAETLYRQGHVRTADAILAEALPIVARGEGWVDVFARGYATLARCRYRLAGPKAALAVADRAEEIAEDRRLPRLALVAHILRVETLTDAGLLDSAVEAAGRLPDPRDEARWPARRENRDARVALARLQLRGGDAAGAATALRDLMKDASEGDDVLTGLTAEILLTEAVHAFDTPAEALRHLLHAVASAEPQGLVEPFAAEGEALRQVVRSLVRRYGLTVFSPSTGAFVNRIMATGSDGTPTPRPGMLSAREADVLSLLAAGRSNKEIARELGVAEATAKFHLKNLFAKLGASRRTMAVSVARAMGLIEMR